MACRSGVVWLAMMAGCGRLGFDTQPMGDARASDTADGTPDARAQPVMFVQGNAGDGGAVSSFGVAFAGTVTAGHLIIATVDYDAAGALTLAVSDSFGTTFHIAGPFANGTNHQFIAYAVAGTTGSDTVIATLDAPASSYLEVRLHEYTGSWIADPLDGAVGTTGSSTAVDGAQTPTITTTSPGELMFAFFTFGGGGTSGTGYTLRSSFAGDVTEDRIATTPGDYRGIATMDTGTSWTGCAAAFVTR